MAFKFNLSSSLGDALGTNNNSNNNRSQNTIAKKPKFDVSSALSEALKVSNEPSVADKFRQQQDQQKSFVDQQMSGFINNPLTKPTKPYTQVNPIKTVSNYLNPAQDEVRQGVWANFGPEVIRKMPVLGSVIQSIDNMSGGDMEQFDKLKKSDYVKFAAQSAGAMVVGPFARIAAQVSGKKQINIGPLGDAGKFESYSNTADTDIRDGMHPALAVLKQTPNVILDALFIYGAAKSAISPRESFVGPSGRPIGKPTTSNVLPGEISKPKSFRLYEPPKPQYIPIDPTNPQGASVIDALSPYSKFEQGKPTYLKVETTPLGSLKARFVQILPSRVKGLFAPGEVGGSPVRVVPETVLETKLIPAQEAMGLVPKTGSSIGLPKTLPSSPVPAVVTPGEFPTTAAQVPNYKPPVEAPSQSFPISKAELKPAVATNQGTVVNDFPVSKFEIDTKTPDVSSLPPLDQKDFHQYIAPKLKALPEVKPNQTIIYFGGDGKVGQYVDTNLASALENGVNANTNVLIVDKSILGPSETPERDAKGYRQLTKAIDVSKPVTKETLQKTVAKPSSELTLEARPTKTGEVTDSVNAVEKLTGNKPVVTKTQVGILLRNIPEFKASPILVVNEKGNLAFNGAKTKFEIVPKALGLLSDTLKPGQKITVKAEDFLKADKIKDNIRVMKGDTALASRSGSKIGTAEQMPDNKPEITPAKEGTPQFKLFEKVEGLIRKYAKTIGEGYLPRNARGVYYRDSQNIFIDGMNNVSTAAHEITHFLDLKYGVIKDLISMTSRGALPRKQLTDLYVQYYSGGSRNHKLELRMREGYATLLQQYATMPETITAQFPTLVKEFLQPGGRFYQPVIGEVIQDLHKMVSDYQNLSSLDKVGATVVTEDFKTNKPSFLNLWEKTRTVMADDIYGLEVLDTKAGVNRSKESVSLLTRGFRNHTSAVFQSNLSGKNGLWTMNQDGEMVKVSDNNIGNLIQQLSKKKITNEFAFYLVARDGYFAHKNLAKLWAQALAGGSTPEATAQLKQEYKDAKLALEKESLTRDEVTKAYNENKDRFIEEEKMYDELTRKGELDILHDALLLDDVKYQELTTKEGYASKKRVFYNELLGDSSISTGSLGVGKTRVSALVKRKGSSRAIQNPLYSLIKDHHEIMNKAGRQHIYNRILNIAPKFDQLFQVQTLKTSPDGRSPMERDPHYIMARKKVSGPEGSKIKRVPILTDNLVKQMLDNILNFEDIHVLEKLLRKASTIKVIGTTASYPAFGAVNVVRDQLTAPVFSVNKYKPVYTAIHELIKSLDPNSQEHVLMKEFFVLGGDHYTLVSFDSQTPEQVLKSVARESRGIKKYTVDVASGGLKALQAPAKYSEVITRASEYIKSRMDGNDQWTAMEDAQRVSGPFAHIGALQPLGKAKMTAGQTFVKSIPFANAGLQIFDQTLRTLADDKGRQRFAFMAAMLAIAFGGALLYTKKKATESQKAELKGYDSTFLSSYIFIPKQSGEGFIRIPVPQNVSTFGSMINMVILNKWLGADYTPKEYANAATTALPQQLNPLDLKQFLFSYFPQLVSGAVQTAFWMRTFPKPMPIESQRMQALPEEFRFNDKTSPVAKFIGEKRHISPIKIDFATTTWLGRATGLLTGNKKALNPLSGFDQGYYWESSRQMDKYWTMKTKMEQDQNAFKKGFTDDVNLENKGLIKSIDKQMTIYNRVVQAGDDKSAKEVQKVIEDLVSQLK